MTASSKRCVGTLGKTACVACRRLKVGQCPPPRSVVLQPFLQMKCVGAHDPPCIRCFKVGRRCIVPSGNMPPDKILPSNLTVDMTAPSGRNEPAHVAFTPGHANNSYHPTHQHPPQWEQGPDTGKIAVINTATTSSAGLEIPMMVLSTPKQQTWDDLNRQPMPPLTSRYSYPNLSSLDTTHTSVQYMHSQIPGPEAEVPSASVPATPSLHSRVLTARPARKLPSDEELSHLCRL